jgi:hypothetical protein
MREKVVRGVGLTPAAYDKEGPKWDVRQVAIRVHQSVQLGDHFKRKVKMTSVKDLNESQEMMDKATDMLVHAMDRFQEAEEKLAASSKKASGTVRASADKLAAGLSKIEKQADFNRLERYVLLLERAEVAMASLAELDREGKLTKIAAALK